MPLSPDEQLHLRVAEVFMELGMYLDADAALDDIDPMCRHLPEVLAVRECLVGRPPSPNQAPPAEVYPSNLVSCHSIEAPFFWIIPS